MDIPTVTSDADAQEDAIVTCESARDGDDFVKVGDRFIRPPPIFPCRGFWVLLTAAGSGRGFPVQELQTCSKPSDLLGRLSGTNPSSFAQQRTSSEACR